MSPDVIVIGAGPAGSVVARRLAVAGPRVTLLTGATTPGYEGLSSRSCQLLHEEGIGLDSAVLVGPLQRSGEWGAGRAVSGTEWLADRVVLADVLRAAAADAGAVVREDPVVSIERVDHRFKVVTSAGRALEAACVVDARGRRGPELSGAKILGVGQRLECTESVSDGTSIHPLSFGWCWLVSRGHERWLQVAARPGDGRPEDWLARALAESPSLAAAVSGARGSGPVVARAAHARRALGTMEPGWLRTGDAAVGLDPLSGQGVYEALRGASVTAAAALSLLDGTDPGLVRRFLAEREDALWQRAVTTAASFYEENAARGEFWSATAGAYRALIVPAQARRNTIERRPVLEGDRIREREVLVTTTHPRGVWQVAGVPVVELVRFLQHHVRPSPAQAAAALEHPPAAIAAAAHWLREAGAWPRPASVPGG